MIIDFHTHILPPEIKENRASWVERDDAFASIYSGEKVDIATAEDLLDSMDREGVDFSVVVNYSWSTHALCVETNNYILKPYTSEDFAFRASNFTISGTQLSKYFNLTFPK